ncbi:uncharacterized protein EI90DRAFT_3127575 [Cantharellus anzutake]|uniref:uncharacterized protein n=1 Tax=Cantharellus anzutake TaxID=1750568 RepID=UPI001903E03C|nr:uncharacterized protein EI90DRAFT_3127575 [Cantharellus anzutake]KAF8326792.1 hypothetical protein EI90DRAFT_3127575 [Cantharellus anzutake]
MPQSTPLIITMKYGQDLEFDTEHLEETVAHFHQNHSFEHISHWSFALASHLRACVVRGTEIIDPAYIVAEHGQVFDEYGQEIDDLDELPYGNEDNNPINIYDAGGNIINRKISLAHPT